MIVKHFGTKKLVVRSRILERGVFNKLNAFYFLIIIVENIFMNYIMFE